ncbi:MAG TPA: twin-arginine translocase TatA/TatE family subunit [Tepidisphaeraceae bacterium]|jgi:sec-independent protein translocase protein TatA
MLSPLALGMPTGGEWIVLALLGLLFFGKRLPEVGRSLGKGIVEFKKGLHELEDHVEDAGATQRPAPPPPQPMGYKFDPYTGKPLEAPNTTPPSSGNPV